VNSDEAIRDLLNISTDLRSVAVMGPDGDLLACGPGAGASSLAAAAARLWDAASARATAEGDAALDHIVVQDATGAVAVLQADGHRIAAVTGAQPAVGLLLFDLRTCLSDAFAEEEPA
jgi:predicted regulator of Ras-like GTPase activity (Roadblock/LC7/MglB family)